MRKSKRSEEAKSGSRSASPISSLQMHYDGSDSEESSVKSKRKNEVDFLWTRVMSLSYRNVNMDAKHSIIKDKEKIQIGVQSDQGSQNNIEWAIFFPDRFAAENKNLKLENYRIGDPKMQEYAVMASRIREKITEKAERLGVDGDFLIMGLDDQPDQ